MGDLSKIGQAGVEIEGPLRLAIAPDVLRSAAYTLQDEIGDGLLDQTPIENCEDIICQILRALGFEPEEVSTSR